MVSRAVVSVVVMGVTGSGKTTVATELARRLDWDFTEGDDHHPPANVAKMRAGIPLDDADRLPWLRELAAWIGEHEQAGRSCVLTCSALRRSYRDVLRGAGARVRFVHLTGSPELLAQRIGSRTGHFMPPSLLASQLSTLEPLQPDEDGVAVDVSGTPEETARAALERLGLA